MKRIFIDNTTHLVSNAPEIIPSLNQDLPGNTNTRNGTRNNFVAQLNLCVPMVSLYEYLTAVPRKDGGASRGRVSE